MIFGKTLPYALMCYFLLLLAGCDGDNENKNTTIKQVNLRLMETTDLHANMLDYNYYTGQTDIKIGLARTATLIRKARQEIASSNTFLVDNGDLIQGSPMGDWQQAKGIAPGEIHPVYQAMNTLNYDVANYGNHEFNYGLEFLAESVNDADFEYISANIFKDGSGSDTDSDELYFQPYVLLDREVVDKQGAKHQITVGFIGFVPPQIMQWDKGNLAGKVKTKDIKAMAERYVPEMKQQGADIVVAIAHSGISKDAYDPGKKEENSSLYLADVPDIDAIMFGHSHLVFPSDTFADIPGIDLEAGTLGGVPSVMPGYWGSHLGIIDLSLEYSVENDSWQVINSRVEARPIVVDGEAVVERDSQIAETLQQAHQDTIEYMSTPIGESSDDLYSFLALVKDDPTLQIVSDAQKDYVETLIQGDVNLENLPVLSAAAPFKVCSREGICADESSFTTVSRGALALSHAADLYLYANTLVAVKVTGAELKGWLECSASQFHRIDTSVTTPQELVNFAGFPTYNFDVIDGVTYEIDITQPARNDRGCEVIDQTAERIVNLEYNGQPVSAEQVFIVATNNYRANGGVFPGTGSDHIVINSPDTNRAILANYIRKNSPIKPTADSNWRFATIDSDSELTVVFRVPDTDRVANYVAEQLPKASLIAVNANNEAVYKLDLQ